MRAPSTQTEREDRIGVVAGGLVVVVGGLALYPPAVFGAIVGLGLGVGLAHGTDAARARASQWWLLSLGLGIGLALALGELASTVVGEERRAFLGAWGTHGPLQPELSALAAHPWGWLPQAIAICAVTATTVLRLKGPR